MKIRLLRMHNFSKENLIFDKASESTYNWPVGRGGGGGVPRIQWFVVSIASTFLRNS